MFYPSNDMPDIWHYLRYAQEQGRPIVLYGMGNGADKILQVCAERGITIRDCFASDGFVRGHSFHGRTVLTFEETCRRYGAQEMIVLLSFATSRPEVLSLVESVAARAELYVPDVPVCGEALFTASFCASHASELQQSRALLADETSRRIFDGVVMAKLSGRLDLLRATVTPPEDHFRHVLHAAHFRAVADLGAYTGDSLRELMCYAPHLQKALAMEPDIRTYKRLCRFAEAQQAAGQGPVIAPVNKGAWSEEGALLFSGTGNRNASFATGFHGAPPVSDTPCASISRGMSGTVCGSGTSSKPIPQAHTTRIAVAPLDHVWRQVMGENQPLDYIKYDVEGAETEALCGSRALIQTWKPALLVSVYHRSEDLFALPLLVHRLAPTHALYLRRRDGVPAWDIDLLAVADAVVADE